MFGGRGGEVGKGTELEDARGCEEDVLHLDVSVSVLDVELCRRASLPYR